ncbi:MAG: hypothetical protein SGJ20_10465 [Planctomycetota bacterium]|nr:hypothetical protein [Planctomycetota bacterium]
MLPRPWVSKSSLALGCCCAALAAIWLWVLPAIGNRESLRRQIEFNRARGLNADAMFYTELEAMPAIRREMTTLLQDHPDAFWRVSGSSDGPPVNDR